MNKIYFRKENYFFSKEKGNSNFCTELLLVLPSRNSTLSYLKLIHIILKLFVWFTRVFRNLRGLNSKGRKVAGLFHENRNKLRDFHEIINGKFN